MDLYAENILDHYKHPRRKTELTVFDAERAEMNLSCGDRVTVRFILDGDPASPLGFAETSRIKELGWVGEGCAISQAGMSLLAEELEGKTLADADALTKEKMLELLGVPVGERRLKCALLSLLAVRNAARMARGQEPLHWVDVATA